MMFLRAGTSPMVYAAVALVAVLLLAGAWWSGKRAGWNECVLRSNVAARETERRIYETGDRLATETRRLETELTERVDDNETAGGDRLCLDADGVRFLDGLAGH